MPPLHSSPAVALPCYYCNDSSAASLHRRKLYLRALTDRVLLQLLPLLARLRNRTSRTQQSSMPALYSCLAMSHWAPLRLQASLQPTLHRWAGLQLPLHVRASQAALVSTTRGRPGQPTLPPLCHWHPCNSYIISAPMSLVPKPAPPSHPVTRS
jgi:hypothetical protein